MLSRAFDWLREYWIVAIIGAVIIGMMVFMANHSKDVAKAKEDVETVKELLADAKKTQSGLSVEFDAKAHQEQLKERTVTASEIAKEIIAVDDILTAFYKTNEPLPQDQKERDALFAELEKAKAENTRLTGAKEADHIHTWKLNPEWTTKLESVVTYRDTDRIPLVFSMTTKDGRSAGLIHAIFNVNNYQLENVTRHYTTVGVQDEVDVGGM